MSLQLTHVRTHLARLFQAMSTLYRPPQVKSVLNVQRRSMSSDSKIKAMRKMLSAAPSLLDGVNQPSPVSDAKNEVQGSVADASEDPVRDGDVVQTTNALLSLLMIADASRRIESEIIHRTGLCLKLAQRDKYLYAISNATVDEARSKTLLSMLRDSRVMSREAEFRAESENLVFASYGMSAAEHAQMKEMREVKYKIGFPSPKPEDILGALEQWRQLQADQDGDSSSKERDSA